MNPRKPPEILDSKHVDGQADIRLAEWLAHGLDTLHIDPILGFFLPGAGDVLGSLLGLVTVAIAARRRLPRIVIARMLLNLSVDGLVGAIPILGDIFDIFHQAHQRNLRLLKRTSQVQARASDWLWVGGAVLLFLAALAAPLVLLGWLISTLVERGWPVS